MRKFPACLTSLFLACAFQASFAQNVKQPPPTKQSPAKQPTSVKRPPVVEQPQKPDTGKWRLIVEIDPMTDKKSLFYTLDAENEVAGIANNSPMKLVLLETPFHDYPAGRCRMYLETGISSREITYPLPQQIRFDKEAAMTFRWGFHGNMGFPESGDGIIVFDEHTSLPSMNLFLSHDTVTFALSTDRENKYAKFDLRGLKVCIKMLEDSKRKKYDEMPH